MRQYYKVSVWDWNKGTWSVKTCSIPTQKKAKEKVAEYHKEGIIARWSNHIGGEYYYE